MQYITFFIRMDTKKLAKCFAAITTGAAIAGVVATAVEIQKVVAIAKF